MRKVYIYIVILCLLTTAIAQDKPYRILNSFSGGQLSELLSAREDLSKYHSGCSLMENFIPLPQGGAEKRPGTVYVTESKNNTKIRLLPFEYSTTQAYIVELGNQYARFFASNAPVYRTYGTEDLSAIGSIVAHWKCNDNLGTTVVIDADSATYNGTAENNTSTYTTTDESGTANKAFNLNGTDEFVTIGNNVAFTFGDGSDDEPFSIAAWVKKDASSTTGVIISKYDGNAGKREWQITTPASHVIAFGIYDETNNIETYVITKNTVLDDDAWHFIVVTYKGTGGATAGNGMKIYVDWVEQEVTTTNDDSYVAMSNQTVDVLIGKNVYAGGGGAGRYWKGDIHNVVVFSKVLSALEIVSLAGSASTTVYEIITPYLTDDLFELKYEQSADVLYITHPDYETKKLSRLSNAVWSLTALDVKTGPFRDQNTEIAHTIFASGTTGSVTLTASGFYPFIAGTTAGHLPSGSVATSKSQTGALFRLIHPLSTLEYSEILTNNYTAVQVEDTSWMSCGTVYEGATWYLTTLGTWTGVLEIQRNYTVGADHDADGWEKVLAYASTDDRNVSTNSTEDIAAASYRAVLTESGDTSEPCAVYFRTNQTEHIGIVEITAVASTISATATVLTTLASTDTTHKWSEGAWSNYRGWPRAVTFFEDRLTFGGNIDQPDTIWASVTADYENMKDGANDDDALLFTLSSRQVNIINWLIGKDKILIGTSGAEWTLAGSADEPLTPSNVKAEQHSTYGSADLQAIQASEGILFFQRGAEKMRELAYSWEQDSYVAPDMTILVPEITGDGIVDVAFQQTPNPILWCVKENGEMATFVYERKEQIASWSTQITDGYFESVAIISGATEDQVWVSVKRGIGGTVRYIEYFNVRDFGSDIDDAYYVDAGITYDSNSTPTITGLTHLNGETVAVLGDGALQANKTVSGGSITITSASTVQVGLPFTAQLRTMPLSWVAQGATIQGRIKRINEVIARYYKAGDFSIGRSASVLEAVVIDGMDTNEQRVTFPPGYDRPGYVFVYQQSAEPLTLLALMVEFQIY